MTATLPEQRSAYWYPDEAGTRRSVALLNALRDYRNAEQQMRTRTRASMRMGETDMAALRFLLQAQQTDRRVTAKDLAAHLAISSASTTALVDRLELSGHVTRTPNPQDRRGIVIEPTAGSHAEVRATIGGMHERMMRVVEGMSPADAQIVMGFLRRMRDAVQEEGGDAAE